MLNHHLDLPSNAADSKAVSMKLVEDKGGAVALMIAALIFLGTWPALLNLLERRGRNPVHSFLDYSLTNMLMAVIIAFTLGEIGDPKPGKPNFTTQLSQVDNVTMLLVHESELLQPATSSGTTSRAHCSRIKSLV